MRPDDRSHNRPLYVTGKPQGLVRQGNIDLAARPTVRNKDGSISTVRSISVTLDDGRAVLLPTVVGNRVVSNDEAVRHFQKTGQNLGIFVNERLANKYGEALHQQQAKMYPNVAQGNPHSDAIAAAINSLRGIKGDMERRGPGDPGNPFHPLGPDPGENILPDSVDPLTQFIHDVVKQRAQNSNFVPVIFPPNTGLGKLQNAYGAGYSQFNHPLNLPRKAKHG